MRNLLAVVLIGIAGAAAAELSMVARPHQRHRRPLSDARRRRLLGAAGVVNGSEDQLRGLARRQNVYVAGAAVPAVLVVATRATALNVVACCAFVAAAWQLPMTRARGAEDRRVRDLDLELNDAIGELVMGVEAGLTFEAVVDTYARRHESVLGMEFRHMLDRIGIGDRRSDVVLDFAERNPSLGVRMFVAAIEQNQRLGTPLADTLRQQGQASRRRRRQAVEEDAAKLSLKMIFPTIFCILPVLLIVIVGPAVVRLVHALPG